MKKKSVGGIPFFITYLSLLISVSFLIRIIPKILLTSPYEVGLYTLGLIIGCYFATMINGYSSVLLHETKHAIFSSLVGNIPKGMNINKDSGDFQYEYTKETQAHNAMIMLAPYWLPVCTINAVILCLIFSPQIEIRTLAIGLAFGVDLGLGLRDVHPYQTDLTDIRGGLNISVSFVIMMNLLNLLFTALFAVKGYTGIKYLFTGIANYVLGT